jgi:hypothetical protein
MSLSARLPLTHALGWIVGSMLCVSGIGYRCIQWGFRLKDRAVHEEKLIRSIVQTGPQKEALKTEYLAELLGLSADCPLHVSAFNAFKARDLLLQSPLIAKADVQLLAPNVLYIDYTVRQPVAFLADYENVAIDKEGYIFPFAPFFSPKNLPEIHLGLAPFAVSSEDPDKPTANWKVCLRGKYLDLALEILAYVTDPAVFDAFNVTWIDVSRAFSPSCGTREIILTTCDALFYKDTKYLFPRTLRLSSKHFAAELGNYLKLRTQLLEEDRKQLVLAEGNLPNKERLIDFRIPNLAFIDEP